MAEQPPSRDRRTGLGLIVFGIVLSFAAVPVGVASFYATDSIPTVVMVMVEAMGPVGLLLIVAGAIRNSRYHRRLGAPPTPAT